MQGLPQRKHTDHLLKNAGVTIRVLLSAVHLLVIFVTQIRVFACSVHLRLLF